VHSCLDDHLEGKLHPATLQLQLSHRFLPETTQAAVEIPTFLARKEQTPDCSQKWIAEIPMRWRHSTRGDVALKAISHDQVVAGAQLSTKGSKAEKS
jgi:hypothetical protein